MRAEWTRQSLSGLARRSFLKGGLLALPATLVAARALEGAGPPAPPVYNVKDPKYKGGATGNGVTDDTSAVRSALSALLASGQGGTLYFPTGLYLLTGTLHVGTVVPVEVVGNGDSSQILWGFNGNLFQWDVSCVDCTFRDFRVYPTVAVSAANAVVPCTKTLERGTFQNLLFERNGNLLIASGVLSRGITDTTSFVNCVMFGISGTGIEIGRGSEVRIIGGRIIGALPPNRTSTGIHLTGDNGGVHVAECDVIAHQIGMLIENSSGAGTNREVFITHATFDSCDRGLSILDGCYVSVAGCWAASCDHENIYVGFGGPNLAVTGGTIFNAGAEDPTDPFDHNGLTVNSGTFLLSGVAIRNNLSKGVWVTNAAVSEYVINGCRINDNGIGLDLLGSHCIVSDNVFARNGEHIIGGGLNCLVVDNIYV